MLIATHVTRFQGWQCGSNLLRTYVYMYTLSADTDGEAIAGPQLASFVCVLVSWVSQRPMRRLCCVGGLRPAWPTPPRGWWASPALQTTVGPPPHLRISLRTLPLCLAAWQREL